MSHGATTAARAGACPANACSAHPPPSPLPPARFGLSPLKALAREGAAPLIADRVAAADAREAAAVISTTGAAGAGGNGLAYPGGAGPPGADMMA